jgi:hypothetical protein
MAMRKAEASVPLLARHESIYRAARARERAPQSLRRAPSGRLEAEIWGKSIT